MKEVIAAIVALSSAITGCQTGKLGILACYSGEKRVLIAQGQVEEFDNGTYAVTVDGGRRRTTNAQCVAIYGGTFKWDQKAHELPDVTGDK